ncbi:hypothetical protein B0H17DRAFT_1108410 [Mycena rosella]|uniref:Uncharacterized protein n=1 Tax=Mycena rosella TaxID=1033263 RepID=A0AAD7BVK4_MYCRO|nr:hypothetical protein B0H17DRAFT_1108410 [Mycena rosella]
MNADHIEIDKYNLLFHYSEARKAAFKAETIQTAFRKTGIWPVNEAAIPLDAYEPAKNYTTQAAQPMPARLPALLVPITNATVTLAPSTSSRSSTTTSYSSAPSLPSTSSTSVTSRSSSATAQASTAPSTPPHSTTPTNTDGHQALHALYRLALPSPLKGVSSRKALAEENERLRYIASLAGIKLEKNHAQMVLMDRENERLRKQVFAKKEKAKTKRSYTTGHARLLTGAEMQAALLQAERVQIMKKQDKIELYGLTRSRARAWDWDSTPGPRAWTGTWTGAWAWAWAWGGSIR